MTFYSPGFIFVFLPVFVLIYTAAGKKMRAPILFLGSLVFYWFASDGNTTALVILISLLLFNYATALFIGSADGKLRTGLYAFGVAIDAAVLLSPKIMEIISNAFEGILPEVLAVVSTHPKPESH